MLWTTIHDRISHANTSHQSHEHIASVTRPHRNHIATPSQPHRNPIATPSSITPFQHALMHSFILLSFFKHLKREKFNINNHNRYAVIIYWEIIHIVSNHSHIYGFGRSHVTQYAIGHMSHNMQSVTCHTTCNRSHVTQHAIGHMSHNMQSVTCHTTCNRSHDISQPHCYTSQPYPKHINPSSMTSFQHARIHSFIFYHSSNISNERNST
jgi:hypothetical protein